MKEHIEKDHPEKKRKTYAEDFLEKYPDAEKDDVWGNPAVCRDIIFPNARSIGCGDCDAWHSPACKRCWDQEMEDQK